MSQEKIAFVLGNGLSRKPIDPQLLKQHGRIYGCNALYRTFAPDYLVAVDTKMIMEIQKTDYAHKHQVWSNGPTALFLASTHDNAKIYILGFDYVGTGNNHELVNNIYAGTKNYKNLNDRATYHGNWQRQTASCINQFVRTKYIRVMEEDSYIPDNLVDCKNLKHMSTRIFCKTFGITPSKS